MPRKFDLRDWILPLILASTLVFGVHRSLANPAPSSAELANYLLSNSLILGKSTQNGFQQIYYFYNGNSIYLTDNNTNHYQPVSSGEYVAWVEDVNGAGQIMLYNVLTKARLQITNTGTNLKPAISGNKVVWEGWQDEKWHIFYFDGTTVSRLSSGNIAIRPSIRGDDVIYAEMSPSGQWRSLKHNVQTDETEVLDSGDEFSAWPRFNADGEIETRYKDRIIR